MMYFTPRKTSHPVDTFFSRRLTVVYDILYYGCQSLIDYIVKAHSDLHPGDKVLSVTSEQLAFYGVESYSPDCNLLILCDHSYCSGRPVLAQTMAKALRSFSRKGIKVIVFVDSAYCTLASELLKQSTGGSMPGSSLYETIDRLKGAEFDRLVDKIFNQSKKEVVYKTPAMHTGTERKYNKKIISRIKQFVIYSAIPVEDYEKIVWAAEFQRQGGILECDDFIDKLRKFYRLSLTEADFC